MTVAAGVAVLSGAHWWQSAQTLKKATAEYRVALMRDELAYDEEKPAHSVTLRKPFYMSKFEVT